MRGRVHITLALLIIMLCGFQCVARADEPCAVVTATVTSFEPKTPLERLYFATSVCYRRRALDAESRVRSSSVSLAVRQPETLIKLIPVTTVEHESIWPTLFAGVGGFGLGVIACVIFLHHTP